MQIYFMRTQRPGEMFCPKLLCCRIGEKRAVVEKWHRPQQESLMVADWTKQGVALSQKSERSLPLTVGRTAPTGEPPTCSRNPRIPTDTEGQTQALNQRLFGIQYFSVVTFVNWALAHLSLHKPWFSTSNSVALDFHPYLVREELRTSAQ